MKKIEKDFVLAALEILPQITLEDPHQARRLLESVVEVAMRVGDDCLAGVHGYDARGVFMAIGETEAGLKLAAIDPKRLEESFLYVSPVSRQYYDGSVEHIRWRMMPHKGEMDDCKELAAFRDLRSFLLQADRIKEKHHRSHSERPRFARAAFKALCT